MFSGNRDSMRQVMLDAWQKAQSGQPLTALEQTIAHIIAEHPEYHALFSGKADLEKDFLDEHNPYLHIGLHLSIHEQVQTNRPEGITSVYQQLLKKHPDPMAVEHRMIEHLMHSLMQAQKANVMPDETAYLNSLKTLL